MAGRDKPKGETGSTGGGIGDIPAQPVNPASPRSGETDPRFVSDGVDTHENPNDPNSVDESRRR